MTIIPVPNKYCSNMFLTLNMSGFNLNFNI